MGQVFFCSRTPLVCLFLSIQACLFYAYLQICLGLLSHLFCVLHWIEDCGR